MNRRRPVFLLAGDPGNRRAKPDPLVRAVFDNCGVVSPSNCVRRSCQQRQPRFFSWVSDYFMKSGSGPVRLAPTCRRFERSLFEKTCATADAVFISGGDVEEGITSSPGAASPLLERTVSWWQANLRSFGRQHHVGPRLGAWRDEDDSVGCRFSCLGIANVSATRTARRRTGRNSRRCCSFRPT